MLRKTEGRRKGWQKNGWLDGITDLMDMNLSKLQEMVKDGEAWSASVHGKECRIKNECATAQQQHIKDKKTKLKTN